MSASERFLQVTPLTAEGFAPFGDVIEAPATVASTMNDGAFARFDNLANLETTDDAGCGLSLVRCQQPAALPLSVSMMECHPLGSQAFVPLNGARFIVAVAPARETLDEERIAAFATNGRQGINYAPGVWHMPLTAYAAGAEFVLLERRATGGVINLKTVQLTQPLRLYYRWE